MKKTNNPLSQFLALIIAVIFFTQSCTIQKRTVNKGYFVQWNINKGVDKSLISSKKELKKETIIQEPQTISQAENQVLVPKNEVIQNEIIEKVIEPTKVPVVYENVIQNKVNSKIDFKENPRKNILDIKPFQKIKRVAPAMDGELLLNFILIFVFLGLGILFLMLALKATQVMMIVYGILSLVSFILFITQVVDVIMY